MTPRFLMWSLTTAALLSASCAPEGTSLSPPKLVFAEVTHAFGHVEAGRRVTHSYTFRNAGGLDLSVDNLRTGCDCTAAAPATRLIPPGGNGAIDVSCDTTHALGHNAHTITVYANDPIQPVTTLTMVADIDAPAAADPAELYVGHLRRGQRAVNGARLLATGATTIGSIDTTGPVLDASLSGANAAAAPRQLRVAIKADAPLGRFRESVRVRTSSARQPLLAIPVVGIVDGEAPPRTTEQR